MAETTKHHERIWLQTEPESTGEVTWCEDKINDDDIEYIRVDLFTCLKTENEQMRDKCLRLIREIRQEAPPRQIMKRWIVDYEEALLK